MYAGRVASSSPTIPLIKFEAGSSPPARRSVGKMEPLSAIASVAGILTAASEVAKLLGPYAAATRSAAAIASQMESELLQTRVILHGLQGFVSNLSGSPVRYAFLIQVDDLIEVLTDGVLIFDELQSILQTLPSVDSPGTASLWRTAVPSARWVNKKDPLLAIFARLQGFKSSITCILNILQSDFQARAEESHQKLLSLVGSLQKNSRLPRVSELAHEPPPAGVEVADSDPQQRSSLISQQQRMSVTTVGPGDTSKPSRFSLFKLPFEEDLKTSGPYLRAKRETMDYSFRSSVARSHAWSVYSGMSLSDISELSVLALPIYRDDLVNSQHYQFGDHDDKPRTDFPAPRTAWKRSIFHECVEIEMQLSQLEDFKPIILALRQSTWEDVNPLELLRNIFLDGQRLLELFKRVDHFQQSNLSSLLLGSGVGRQQWSTQLCADQLGLTAAECPIAADLLAEDTTQHLKLIRLLQNLLQRLTAAGEIRAVLFNPSIPFATETFLLSERAYVGRLEELQQSLVKIGWSSGYTDNLSSLVNVQRKFLLAAEEAALKPWTEQRWDTVFSGWSQQATTSYPSMISGEIEAADTLKRISSSNVGDGLMQELTRAVLPLLSAPAERLRKYRSFVEGLSTNGQPGEAQAARCLEAVEGAVNVPLELLKLRTTNQVLYETIAKSDRKDIAERGELLLFASDARGRVRQMISTNDLLRSPVHIEVYLYRHVLLFVSSHSTRDGQGSRSRLSRIRVATSTRQRRNLQKLINMCDVFDVQSKDTDGIVVQWQRDGVSPTYDELSFELPDAKTRDKWVASLRGKMVPKPLRFARSNFRAAILGTNSFDQEELKLQFELAIGYQRNIQVDGRYAKLDLNEVVYVPEYVTTMVLHDVPLNQQDGCIFVYNIANGSSFRTVEPLYKNTRSLKDSYNGLAAVLVGVRHGGQNDRVVTADDGRGLAKKLGIKFFEVNLDTKANVLEPFFELMREIWRLS
ncbi:hypothetical protein B0T14DRAFT_602332 [Immersiella caudata]|uniref:DH domain-containing protein n=1 Tax=Immersiella caudata TaxID=314043 RepID=A0AA40C3N1_9PEZI|nr:hypothetical protein B0T14DRAFT_602332 [Immersiella caudata]